MSKLHGLALLLCLGIVNTYTITADRYEHGRIVNGTDALPKEFPFMVSLKKTLGKVHFCAGTIIDNQWILTAAHCFTYIKSPTEFYIQYGEIILNPKNKKVIKVLEIHKHDGYNPTVAIHDIALLRLEKPLEFNANVSAVKLPETSYSINDMDTATLLGWGLNETNGSLHEILQKVDLQLITLMNCRHQLNSFIYNTNLCAGSASTANKGQCSGDSGGPLLHQDIQIGVVSWSLKPCATKPGVFTNVSYYTQWIKEKLKIYIENLKNKNKIIKKHKIFYR